MDRVHLIDPLDVEELHNAMSRSFMVMTDSGGIQEEAPALAKPVLVLRKETERPEAVAAGTVKIAGVEKDEYCTSLQRNCLTVKMRIIKWHMLLTLTVTVKRQEELLKLFFTHLVTVTNVLRTFQ